MQKLSETDIAAQIALYPTWRYEARALTKIFIFKDFVEAFAFICKVADIAEEIKHHPEWTNVYNKVEIWLSTHDAGDVVTEKDHKLAKKIDALL